MMYPRTRSRAQTCVGCLSGMHFIAWRSAVMYPITCYIAWRSAGMYPGTRYSAWRSAGIYPGTCYSVWGSAGMLSIMDYFEQRRSGSRKGQKNSESLQVQNIVNLYFISQSQQGRANDILIFSVYLSVLCVSVFFSYLPASIFHLPTF